MKIAFLSVLFNKYLFLSMKSKKDKDTFVRYLNLDYSKLAPMTLSKPVLYPFLFRVQWLKVTLFALGLTAFQQVSGQGWEIYFGGNADDFAEAVITTANGGYLVVGYSESFGDDNDMDVYVLRTDIDGQEIWSTPIDEGFVEHGYDVIRASDGGYIIVGDIRRTQLDDVDVYLLKIDENGNLIWSRQYGGDQRDQGFAVTSTPDGGYAVVGRTASFGNGEEDVYLIKTDVNGMEQWSKTFGNTDDDEGKDIITFDGGLAIVGAIRTPTGGGGQPLVKPDVFLLLTDENGNEINNHTYGGDGFDEGWALAKTLDGGLIITGSKNDSPDLWLIKTDQNGEMVWSKTLGGDLGDLGKDVIQLKDSSYVAVGITELTPSNAEVFLVKVDANGNELWTNALGRNTHFDDGVSIQQTPEGGFILTGINSLSTVFFNDISLIKTDSSGNVFTSYLQGKVFFDEDAECDFDEGETALQDWLIMASGEQTFFGTTDVNGNYCFRVDTGSYDVTLLPKNTYWNICEGTISDVQIHEFYDTTFVNFPVKDSIACPLLEVDVSTPFLLPCSTRDFTLSYCNNGPASADSAYVEVMLDADLIFNSATLPVASQQGNSYVFDLGILEVGECGNFQVNATLSCDAVPGQAIFVSAHIFPDTICAPPDPNWDGASIDVSGQCVGDSVKFFIQNVGVGDMQEALEYIVIEDQIIGRTGNYKLISGGNIEITTPATGETYRIVAMQSPGHPGDSYPTVAVEGCVENGGNQFSTGQVAQFQENENDPFISIEVQEVLSSDDALDLRGYPKGYLRNDTNYIAANTDIEYQIRFRNTGTDTIENVWIRDTLSSFLDATSVRPGASSHPYDFQIYDNGILKFTFNNIHLPPGSSAETASDGFVKFKVSQKPDNPVGSRIDNSTAIFLGYNEPFETETFTHYVGGELLEFVILTNDSEVFVPDVKITAYPNPFVDAVQIEIKGARVKKGLFSLFDLSGRLLRQEHFSGNFLRVFRNDLAKGMYVYKLEAEGQLLNTGKIIVQ